MFTGILWYDTFAHKLLISTWFGIIVDFAIARKKGISFIHDTIVKYRGTLVVYF